MRSARAAEFAEKAHAGQFRRGGKPYYSHVQSVAAMVRAYTEDEDIIAAAYLHDTLEDCAVTPEELSVSFNPRVTALVQELTNNDALLEQMGKEEYMVRKLSAMSAEALLIKLCDTLHNMSETDRPTQAGTYARIQRRLQESLPANWSSVHQALSQQILAIYSDEFGPAIPPAQPI